MPIDGGSCAAASSSTVSMALRRSLPGFSVAVSGTARRWPSRGSSGATARSVTVTKEESGTMRPCAVRTNDVLEVARIVDGAVGRLRAHRDGVALDVVFAHLLAVEQRGERRAERLHRHAEIGGRLAVDRDGELRLRRVVVDAHRVEAGPVLQRLAHLLRLVGERVVVGAGDGELQALAAAADAEAVRLARGDLHAGDLLQPRD